MLRKCAYSAPAMPMMKALTTKAIHRRPGRRRRAGKDKQRDHAVRAPYLQQGHPPSEPGPDHRHRGRQAEDGLSVDHFGEDPGRLSGVEVSRPRAAAVPVAPAGGRTPWVERKPVLELLLDQTP